MNLPRLKAEAFGPRRENVEINVWPLEATEGAACMPRSLSPTVRLASSSANFTGHALDQNLEVGMLVTGGHTPRRLNEHVHALNRRRVTAEPEG